jgi:predicted aspartyl protease
MAPFLGKLALFALAIAGPGHEMVPMHRQTVRYELKEDSVTVPMNIVDGRIILDVTLNGKGPFPFIFDTGAQGSVMDLAFAREQRLDLGQEVMVGSPSGPGRPGAMVTIQELAIEGLTLKGMTSIAFDGLPFPRNETSPRGVLSPYGLSGLLVKIDYAGRNLVFTRGALPEPDGREVFGWDSGQALPEIPATVGGLPIKCHLDSGASSGVTLPTSFASQLTLDGPLVDMGYAKAVDHVWPVRGAPLQGALTIGRYTLDRPLLRFMDRARGAANVGAAVLNQFVITIDPANSRLRLEGPSDGRLKEPGDLKPHYGLQFEALDADPLVLLVVDAGSPAENGGLRAGDRILSLNGHPIGEIGASDRVDAFKASPLEVTVRRGEETFAIRLALP